MRSSSAFWRPYSVVGQVEASALRIGTVPSKTRSVDSATTKAPASRKRSISFRKSAARSSSAAAKGASVFPAAVAAAASGCGVIGRFTRRAASDTPGHTQPVVAGAALFAFFEYYRLPVALMPPVGSSESEQERYLALLRKRLKANPKFQTKRLESLDDPRILSATAAIPMKRESIGTMMSNC